jgi:hypothetical protein
MRKRAVLIVFIAFIAAGVLGLGFIIAGATVHQAEVNRYYKSLDRYADPLGSIQRSFTAFGASGETLGAIGDFLKTMPADAAGQCNIVIVGKDGVPVYKTNDQYLHLQGGALDMAWEDGYSAVIMDYAANQRHWFSIQYMDGMGGGLSSDTTPDFVGSIHEPLQDADHMITAYDGTGTEADVYIFPMEKDDKPYYLMWFLPDSAYREISSSIRSNQSSFTQISIPAGIILIVAYWLLGAVWVFLDARRRQTQPLPWALLVLLTNLVGLAVYWIYQAQNAKTGPACPACGKAVGKNHVYCPWCGAPLVQECKGCGKPLEKGWVSCPWCGKTVE